MKRWGRRVYKVFFPIIWRQIVNCLRKKWVALLYRKARILQCLPYGGPYYYLQQTQRPIYVPFNFPIAWMYQKLILNNQLIVGLICWKSSAHRPNICLYYLLLLPTGPQWWLLNISIDHFVIWNILLNPLNLALISFLWCLLYQSEINQFDLLWKRILLYLHFFSIQK